MTIHTSTRDVVCSVNETTYHSLEFRTADFSPRPTRNELTFLFVHGLCHQASIFDHVIESLAGNHGIRAVAISLEGHGKLSPLREDRNSINDLSKEDYIRDLLAAIRELEQTGSNKILLGLHSLASSYGRQLLNQGMMPESVQGIVLINPVPDKGMFQDGANAAWVDLWRSLSTSPPFLRPTPLSFLYTPLIKKDVKGFFEASPERTASLFFSSDINSTSDRPSRIIDGDINTFCDNQLAPDSSKVFLEMLLKSKYPMLPNNTPILVYSSENDRLISNKSIVDMVDKMSGSGYKNVRHHIAREISHDTPYDIDYEKFVSQIAEWSNQL